MEAPPSGGLPPCSDLILASIVQKEDFPGHEYGLVASVFLNRLKTGMRLDSCASVEFTLGYNRPFLLRSDIAVQSPYDTYRIKGLPPLRSAFSATAHSTLCSIPFRLPIITSFSTG